jgi:hypothetical protein
LLFGCSTTCSPERWPGTSGIVIEAGCPVRRSGRHEREPSADAADCADADDKSHDERRG